MLNLLFTSVLELSLSTGLVVAVFLALSPVLGKTVWPRWRCLLWTLLALRLLLPFPLPGQDAPVHLSLPTQAVSAPVVSTPSAPASDQTSSEAAAAASLTWLDLSALAWAAGGTGFLAWQGIAYIRFRQRILRRQHREADPQLQALFQDLAIQMGLARPVSLVVSENAPSPITLGLLHPLVILPPLDADQEKLTWILRHELAHQAEGHLWCKLLLLLARAVHWFNPLVHQVARQAARDLELACDNRVVAGASPVQRRAYARTLLAALETASASTTSLSTPWQGGSSMMKQRFHNLFSPIPRRRGRMLPAIALAAVLCLGGLVSCASGPQATLPQEPTDLQSLPHLQYTARPGMLIKDAQLTTPFCLSPTDTADASGAPAEQMIPLEDAQPLKQGDVVLLVGSIGSHYQVILPALDPPFLEGTLPQSAVSTDPGQFAQANLGTVGADTPCYLTPEDTSAVSVFSDPCLVSVSSRAGGWAKVQAPGGGAPVWVRSQDLSYDFTWTGRTVDLSQLTV